MDLGLAGKTAAVMAASEGLGRAAATALAREGAHVTLCARRAPQLNTTVAELRTAFPKVRVEGVVADVTRRDDVERFVRTAAEVGQGTLDVLVTNSGGPPPKQFEALEDEDWQRAFELLVLSNVRATRTALPFLRRRGGAIVNITSTSVKQPLPSLILSNSLRLAVVGLAKTLATELASQGIRVNNVCPGSMDTERIRDVTRFEAERLGVPFEQAQATREREIPLGRWGRPEELGDVVAFLASPRASYLTGTTVSVDGGIVRWTFG